MQSRGQLAAKSFVDSVARLRVANDAGAVPAGDLHSRRVFAKREGERAANEAGADDGDSRDEVAGRHRLRDAAADGWGDDAELAHELRELARLERLRAVGERVVGVVVDFDQQALAPGAAPGAL